MKYIAFQYIAFQIHGSFIASWSMVEHQIRMMPIGTNKSNREMWVDDKNERHMGFSLIASKRILLKMDMLEKNWHGIQSLQNTNVRKYKLYLVYYAKNWYFCILLSEFRFWKETAMIQLNTINISTWETKFLVWTNIFIDSAFYPTDVLQF